MVFQLWDWLRCLRSENTCKWQIEGRANGAGEEPLLREEQEGGQEDRSTLYVLATKTTVNGGTDEMRLHTHYQKRRKKKENDKHWPGGRSGETGTLTDAGGNVKWYSRYWKQMSLKKLNRVNIRSSNSTCGYTSKRTKHGLKQISVHRSSQQHFITAERNKLNIQDRLSV